MTRDEILEQVQNNNDEVGSVFNNTVKETTERYEMGIIHHEEYLRAVQRAVNKANENLIVIDWTTENTTD